MAEAVEFITLLLVTVLAAQVVVAQGALILYAPLMEQRGLAVVEAVRVGLLPICPAATAALAS